MFEDLKQEGFTKKEVLIYGVVLPLASIIVIGIGWWLEFQLAEL